MALCIKGFYCSALTEADVQNSEWKKMKQNIGTDSN